MTLMHLLPLIIVSSTALGIGYFCVDFYRNRHRLSTQPNPPADLLYSDTLSLPDGGNGQSTEKTLTHVGHAVSEASHTVSHGVEHWVDAIAHTVSHH